MEFKWLESNQWAQSSQGERWELGVRGSSGCKPLRVEFGSQEGYEILFMISGVEPRKNRPFHYFEGTF